MTQHLYIPDYLIESVLCCPRCRHWPLQTLSSKLLCKECNWQSELVGHDTLNFAPAVYDGARNKTKRVKQRGLINRLRMSRLKKMHDRLIPWRQWIFQDTAFWRDAIMPLRQREIDTVQRILANDGNISDRVILELGVGFQDHLELYEQIAGYAICSDIYRDPLAVQIYKDVPWLLYCLINVESLPIRESSVDFLLTSHVVEHFPNRTRNLKNIHKILKPGALACHVVPLAPGIALGHLLTTAANMIALVPRLGQGIHGEFDSWWQEICQTTVRAWINLFEYCGFQILKSTPGTLGISPLRPSVSLWLSDHLHIYGSWIFLMRAI